MQKVNLSGMTVEALMDLRKRVDETLNRRRAELEKQLAMFGGRRGVVRGGGGSALKGRKSRRNIAVRKAKLGQVVGQSQSGLLLPSRAEGSSMIF